MAPAKKPSSASIPKTAVAPAESKGGDYYRSLPDAELDALWKQRDTLPISESDQAILRGILRDRKGFKPVEVFVSMCQRCNLPADNCACLNR